MSNLPILRPFYLQSLNRQWHHIDWKEFSSINIDELSLKLDPTIFHKILPFVAYCNIENEFKEGLDSNFLKLYRLAQLLIEYLVMVHQQLTEQFEDVKKERDQFELNLEKQRIELAEKRKELRLIRKEKHKRIKILEKVNSDKNCKNSYSLHSCSYCNKQFFSVVFLHSHIERRHGPMPTISSPVNNLTNPLKPDAMTEEGHQNQFELLHSLIAQLQIQLKESHSEQDEDKGNLINQNQITLESYNNDLNGKVLEQVSNLEQAFWKKVNAIELLNQRDFTEIREESTRNGVFQQEIGSEVSDLFDKLKKMDNQLKEFQFLFSESKVFNTVRSNLGELEDDSIVASLPTEFKRSYSSTLKPKSCSGNEQQKVEDFIEAKLGIELERIQRQLRTELLQGSEDSNKDNQIPAPIRTEPCPISNELKECSTWEIRGIDSVAPEFILDTKEKNRISKIQSTEIEYHGDVPDPYVSDNSISNCPTLKNFSVTNEDSCSFILGERVKSDFLDSQSSIPNTKSISKSNYLSSPVHNVAKINVPTPDDVVSIDKSMKTDRREPCKNMLLQKPMPLFSSSSLKTIRNEFQYLLLERLRKKSLSSDTLQLSDDTLSSLMEGMESERESYSLKYTYYYSVRRDISEDVDLFSNLFFTKSIELPKSSFPPISRIVHKPKLINIQNFLIRKKLPNPTLSNYSPIVVRSHDQLTKNDDSKHNNILSNIFDSAIDQDSFCLENSLGSDPKFDILSSEIQEVISVIMPYEEHPESLNQEAIIKQSNEESIPSDFSLSDMTDNTDIYFGRNMQTNSFQSQLVLHDSKLQNVLNTDGFESDFSDN